MMQEIIRRVPSGEEVRDYLLLNEWELYERLYYEAYKELIDEGYAGYSLKREYGWDNELVVERVIENLRRVVLSLVEAREWKGVEELVWKMKKEVMQ
jgi:hypothetical protein